MKTLTAFVFVIFMLLSSSGMAQVAEQGPIDLSVLKCSWSKERVGWERDPFGAPDESFNQMRTRTRDEKRLETAKRSGNIAEANKLERELHADEVLKAREGQKTPARYVFSYKIAVKNGGARAIKAVDWDYIFFDAATGQEINRHQFSSDEKIAPGKTKELTILFRKPPTQIISAQSLHKNEREGLGERVVLVRVEYSDGTVWQRQ